MFWKLAAIFIVYLFSIIVVAGINISVVDSENIIKGITYFLESPFFFLTFIYVLLSFLAIMIIKLILKKLKKRDNYTWSLVYPVLVYMLFKYSGPINVFDFMSYKIFFNNLISGYESLIFIVITVGILNYLYYFLDVNDERNLD